MINFLIALHATVRLTVLPQAIMLRWLVITAVACGRSGGIRGTSTGSLATLLASLVRVDLAVSKLASTDTAIGLAILTETAVLYRE